MRGLIEERVNVGARQRASLDTEVFTETLKLNLQTALDGQLAADPVETFQALAQLRTTYEATVAVTATSQQMRGLMQRI
jgi:hypothetical protein